MLRQAPTGELEMLVGIALGDLIEFVLIEFLSKAAIRASMADSSLRWIVETNVAR